MLLSLQSGGLLVWVQSEGLSGAGVCGLVSSRELGYVGVGAERGSLMYWSLWSPVVAREPGSVGVGVE